MPFSRTDLSLQRFIPIVALVLIVAAMLGVTLMLNSDKQDPVPVPNGVQASVDGHANPVSDRPMRQVAAVDFNPGDWKQRREAIHAGQARKAQGERRELMQRYAAEDLDPVWAAAKEATMFGASTSTQIAQLEAEPQALDISCRSTTCRIEADFASASLAEDWFTLFSTNLGAEMPHASFEYSRQADGSARVVVYGIGRK